jgi:5-oxoprolinase (ATP-hydrolysing)
VGVVRVNRFLADTIVTCEGERHDSDEPWGIFGGHDGLNASLVKNPGADDEESWPSKVTAYRLRAGDALQITTPSAGGYGDPLDRDPQLVLQDVLDGITSAESAERDYGVILDREAGTLDAEATARAREAARSGAESVS